MGEAYPHPLSSLFPDLLIFLSPYPPLVLQSMERLAEIPMANNFEKPQASQVYDRKTRIINDLRKLYEWNMTL